MQPQQYLLHMAGCINQYNKSLLAASVAIKVLTIFRKQLNQGITHYMPHLGSIVKYRDGVQGAAKFITKVIGVGKPNMFIMIN